MLNAVLVGDSPVRLWSLSSRERIRRQLASVEGVRLVEDESGLPAEGRVMVLRCDFLYELRTLKSLATQDDLLLLDDSRTQLAAAVVPVAQLAAVRQVMEAGRAPGAEDGIPEAIPRQTREVLGVYDAKLRRADAPMLEPLREDRAAWLEDQLYGNAYKGITDLVTKWLWPRPAKKLVRLCAALGISPNQVTWVSFILVILAGVFFYQGDFAWGLACGWVMTLLDTVDGKLARVTVQASRIGHIFDHGIDLIHPPFWYLLWALGLAGQSVMDASQVVWLAWLVFGGYIGGRLAELGFQRLCGGSIFAWRPFDSWFRLVTARRNPCLIILTLALLVGAPQAGIWVVAAWTVLSTLVLLVRLGQGLSERRRTQAPLESWLARPDAAEAFPQSYTVFSGTRGAYAP